MSNTIRRSGRAQRRRKTKTTWDFERTGNLFDDPDRDAGSDTRAADTDLVGLEDDVDVCGTCQGTGLVTYPDELSEDECHVCNGTGYCLLS